MSKLLIFLGLAAVVFLAALLAVFMPFGAKLAAKIFLWRHKAVLVTFSRLEGSLAKGVTIENVEVSGFSPLPAGSSVTIQSVRVEPDFLRFFAGRIRLVNGKVVLPDRQTVFFSGSAGPGMLDLNFFSPSLSVSALSALLFQDPQRIRYKGTLGKIDLFVRGTRRQPHVQGTFFVESLAFSHAVASGIEAALDLRFSSLSPLQVAGALKMFSGTLTLPNSAVVFEPGRVLFSGDFSNPGLDLHGNALVGETRIRVFLSGTLRRPDLQLSSVPVFPRDRLLLMLLTGRSWQSAQDAVMKQSISADITKELLDFLFLGGSFQKLQSVLGIEGIALTYNQTTRGFEIKKSVTGSASVVYGLAETKQQSVGEVSGASLSQKVGLEYKLSEKLSLEWSRQVQRDRSGSNPDKAALPQEEIGLKFKKSF